MAAAREFFGFIMAALFTTVAFLMMVMAWTGLEHEFGWEIAAAALVFSFFIRINVFVIAGVYLFSTQVWGLGLLDTAMLTLPGLMFLSPGIATVLFGAVSRPQTHY